MTRLSPLPVGPRVDAAYYPVVHASATRLVTEWNTTDDDGDGIWVRDPVVPTRAWLREWEGELCNFVAGQLPGGYLACDADDWDDWPPTFTPILHLAPILGDRLAGLNPVVVVDPVWYLAVGQAPMASPPPVVGPEVRRALARTVARLYWATMRWAAEEAHTLFPARTRPARPQEDTLADLLAWWIECLGDIPGGTHDRRYDEAVNDLDPYGVWQSTSHPHYPAFGITIPARRLYQVGWQRLTSLYPGPHPTLDTILARIATT